MRKVTVVFLFALTAGSAAMVGPVVAQDHVQKYREADPDKTPGQEESEKRAARAYERSLSSVPDKKSADPWSAAGSDSASQSAPKAKPVAKTAAPKPAKPANSAAN
jgi:hypothetical protein